MALRALELVERFVVKGVDQCFGTHLESRRTCSIYGIISAMSGAIDIKPLGEKDTGRCACCGRVSRKIWGVWGDEPHGRGSYFVHWTVGHVFESGADIDLIFAGPKTESKDLPDFHAVSIKYRIFDNGPQMMVVDATEQAFAMSPRIGHCLKRNDVIGGPLAKTVFDICDAFLLQDTRLAALWDAPQGR